MRSSHTQAPDNVQIKVFFLKDDFHNTLTDYLYILGFRSLQSLITSLNISSKMHSGLPEVAHILLLLNRPSVAGQFYKQCPN